MLFLKNHGISIIALGLAVAALILSITKSSGKSPTGLFFNLFTTKFKRDKTFDPPPKQKPPDPKNPLDRKPKNWSSCPGWQCGRKVSADLKIWTPEGGGLYKSKFIHNDTCGNYRCVKCPDDDERRRWVHKDWGATHGTCRDKPTRRSSGGAT